MAKQLFQPGVSGNPSGRPKGIKDQRSVYREMLEQHADELINKAYEMALDGNEQMLKLLLDRILPPKPREETAMININPNQIREQSNEAWQALTDGDISAATLVHLLKAIVLHTQIIDKDMEYQFRTGLAESMAAFRRQEALDTI